MLHEKQRVMAMVNEVTNFLIENGIYSIFTNIEENVKDIRIYIYCTVSDVEFLHQLEKKTSYSRAKALEEMYWGLLGDVNSKEVLSIIGHMVDSADVDYMDSDVVKISLIRKKE